MKYLSFYIISIFLLSCSSSPQGGATTPDSQYTVEPATINATEAQSLDTATFAGGCFWCVEAVFERVIGVKSVVSGYAGGINPNPTYQEVAAGKTEYAESVQILYDPEQVSYQSLIEVFFGTHDPTQLNRQGPDVGKQYRSEVFFHNNEQKQAVEAYMEKLKNGGKYDRDIVTRLNPLETFYLAEDYHQNYYEHHPNDRYILSIAVPKVKKFKKNFPELLKKDVS